MPVRLVVEHKHEPSIGVKRVSNEGLEPYYNEYFDGLRLCVFRGDVKRVADPSALRARPRRNGL